MSDTKRSAGASRTPVQLVTMIISAVFLLVGVLGFIPGITTDYDTMQFAGHESTAMLFGVFQVSILHNIVHLLFGVVGFALARSAAGARAYLIGGGLIYLVLWIYGLVVGHGSDANFVPLNNADNWLHLGLAAGMILLGLLLGGRTKGVTDTGHAHGRHERHGSPDRPARSDLSDRSDPVNRPGRPERHDLSDQEPIDRPARTDRTDRPDRPDLP
ncbi:MAG TPA: DUF4383 domain-containing protein [Glycomyces sp.]|nr:DUF4383 domain-containing protein [Glycomyces sp.]